MGLLRYFVCYAWHIRDSIFQMGTECIQWHRSFHHRRKLHAGQKNWDKCITMSYSAIHKTQESFRIIAQSDESITSTQQQNDDELFFEAEPDTNYFIQVLLITTCASATPDMRYDFENAISGANWLMGGDRRDKDGAGNAGSLTPQSSGHLGAISIAHSGTAAAMWSRFECVFQTNANGGTCHMRWGQNTSDATALIRKAGSYMIVTKVGANV